MTIKFLDINCKLHSITWKNVINYNQLQIKITPTLMKTQSFVLSILMKFAPLKNDNSKFLSSLILPAMKAVSWCKQLWPIFVQSLLMLCSIFAKFNSLDANVYICTFLKWILKKIIQFKLFYGTSNDLFKRCQLNYVAHNFIFYIEM